MGPMARQAEALRRGSVGGVERAPLGDQPLVHRGVRLVGGEQAVALVVHGGDAVALGGGPVAVAEQARILAEVLRRRERPVDVVEGEAAGQAIILGEMRRAAAEQGVAAERSDGGRDLVGQVVGDPHVGGGHRAEVADSGVVGTLGVVQARRHLGDDEVHVRIALAVGVGRPVDGHVVDEVGDIGAVVEVVAPHQILVGLALAGMDGDHQARGGLKQLSDAVHRAEFEFLLGHRALAGGLGHANQVHPRGRHDHVADYRGGLLVGRRHGGLGRGGRLRGGRCGRRLGEGRTANGDGGGGGQQNQQTMTVTHAYSLFAREPACCPPLVPHRANTRSGCKPLRKFYFWATQRKTALRCVAQK